MKNIILKYGLIAGGATILLHLILHFFGISESDTGAKMQWVNYLIFGGAIYMGIKEKLQRNNGFLSFGSAFGTGFLIILLAASLISVYRFTYYSTINPGVSAEAYAKAEAQAEEEAEKRGMDEEQSGQVLRITKMAVSPTGLTIIRFIGILFTGLIFSLIFAAILKRDPPPFTQEEAGQAEDLSDPYK